eukprot:CAMPEP_0185733770 /NCGR_PEP_ID=MMETSP1171-20130828/20460_1 /TAXON_ID=374046 /ORGANISM="Helicotheca tamensis, Strain CCMP826" /LENGTH=355 /DNA_ID=CAMNT_0028403579 /DNA_START=143 /DNA_END=1210 /DNA_ORIENTATION=+
MTITVVKAFTTSILSSKLSLHQQHSKTFLSRSFACSSGQSVFGLSMYIEGSDTSSKVERKLLQLINNEQQLSFPSKIPIQGHHIDEAEAKYGMPWKTSIGHEENSTSGDNASLLYMPFWEWQISFMKNNLTNLSVVPCSNAAIHRHDYHYNENEQKGARIVNMCFESDEYRKIRMTYYDAGQKTQVFNSVWYPHPKYNLPILGVDVLAFNQQKYLAITDYQPIHDAEEKHACTYEHLLKPIRDDYPNLKGRMSNKFYDENQFFSKQMVFSRFEDVNVVHDEFYPAFQRYIMTHVDLLQNTKPDENMRSMRFVLERQASYDTYSAERDPALGLLTAMFGTDWSESYMREFLFDMSD